MARSALVVSALTVCVAVLTAAVQAAIIPTGDAFPSGGDYFVGATGVGDLQIHSGSDLNDSSAYIGFLGGATGTATVSGAGSQWVNTGDMLVGWKGNGTLDVASGGEVHSGYGYVGRDTGTTGDVNLTGGSSWTNSSELHVGWKGTGTINAGGASQLSNTIGYLGNLAAGNGTVNLSGGSQWTNSSMLLVGNYGSGTVTASGGADVSNTTGYLARYAGSTGDATFTGYGTTWTNNGDLYVGNAGTATLDVTWGAVVTSNTGYIGYNAGANGDVEVSGYGSKWTNSAHLYVGHGGSGTLLIDDAAMVSNNWAYLGFSLGASGKVTVSGAGTKWLNTGFIAVGLNGAGALDVTGSAEVAARQLNIFNNQSKARVHVTGDGNIVLGNADNDGSMNNDGAVEFYVDAFLAPGTYSPIAAHAGRSINWTGAGTYNAVIGGTWNAGPHTLTVGGVVEDAAGTVHGVGANDRFIFTDGGSGARAGASFGAVGGGTTLSATPVTGTPITDLQALLAVDYEVLGAWDFVTNHNGLAMLSIEVGPHWADFQVWEYDGSNWAPITPDLQGYSDDGVYSFTADDFSGSGFAVTGTVPEPTALALLGLFGLAALKRRRS